mmetsp:Transcript_12003/g.17550  ORF Transcript_12003/g.17550 Transcript_12003/m.17550 type:complete len:253 (+) Transcript_12003:935-1693(+)
MWASSFMSTSEARAPESFICLVWMRRICCLPSSSGSPTSTWTSSLPGRSTASSIISLRLVIPMIRMLFKAFTPSILDKSWFTTVSWTPVLPEMVPRGLQIASISSKIMMWSCDLSPFSSCSFSASLKSSLMFSSVWPTYLLNTSGPLMILGSRALKHLAICLAIKVFPVPGGPYSSIPFTCFMPSLFITWAGNSLEAKALLNIKENSWSSPPMPSCSKLKLGPSKMFMVRSLLLRISITSWEIVSNCMLVWE